MSFIANQEKEFNLWNYITGNIYENYDSFKGIYKKSLGMSISNLRYDYLMNLNSKDDSFKISCRDPITNNWTKWGKFPGLLWNIEKDIYWVKSSKLTAAVDVHRSVLPNEIVIESDYPTYEENYDAAKIIGAILEKKGFVPHYYYSGNKSVHIHVFLDVGFLEAAEEYLNYHAGIVLGKRQKKIIDRFMEWIRTKMISCWDTQAKKFDKDLIRATHLIRAELSKNKRGFKTFLGYQYKDMSFIPYICNETNRIYPKLAEIIESAPTNPVELLEEFIEDLKNSDLFKKIKKKSTLSKWVPNLKSGDLKQCVRAILSDDFKNVKDGFKRSMFVLVNELRNVHGDTEAKRLVHDWNERMGNPIEKREIDYRFRSDKTFTLTCNYIHELLKDIGFDVSEKCKN